MQGFLKQSTAVNITVLMVDSADHITGKTGLTLTIYATKAAGTPAAITPTVTELDSTNVKGVYKLALTTAHTDTLGELQIHVTSTGADPADYWYQVSTYLPGEAATLQADQAVNCTKFGGTSVTGRDIGASVLLSAGSGTGQLDFTSGVVKANVTQLLGTAWLAPGTAGTPDVNVKLWNGLATVALPLVPTVAGRTLDVSATGEAGLDWANIGAPTTTVNLSGTTVGTVTANSDKTGYSLTQSFPTNFASMAISVGGAVTVGTNSDKTGYALTAAYDAAKTASQAGDAMTLTTAGYAAAADKLLGRNLAGGADGTRTVQDALRLLRNKTSVAAGTLTVTAEDDTTTAWTAAVLTTAGDPISSVDPV